MKVQFIVFQSEADRLKQQFLRTTTVNKQQRPSSLDQKSQSQPFNMVAVLLILIAVVLGYIVGAYTSWDDLLFWLLIAIIMILLLMIIIIVILNVPFACFMVVVYNFHVVNM